MTETPAPIEDRAANIRLAVSHIISSKQDEMFEQFDRLHRRNIHDDDVVTALTQLHELDLLDAYAEWADIDLREDDNTTMNPVVPDPGDAPSYKALDLIVTIEQLVELPHNTILRTKDGKAAQIDNEEGYDFHVLKIVGWDGWLTLSSKDFEMTAADRREIAKELPATVVARGAK
jgi:hypothetical protein